MEYKKLFGILGAVLVIAITPIVLLSSCMMNCYQRKIDEDPNTDSSRDWQFKLAKTCGYTLRPELAAEMYGKFIDRYKKEERRPEAMWRRAQCLFESEKREESKDQYRILIYEYPKHDYSGQADDLLRKQFNDYKRYDKAHPPPKPDIPK